MQEVTLRVPTTAKPTKTDLNSDGLFGLPLVNHTQLNNIEKGNWSRIDLPDPVKAGVFVGDIIHFPTEEHPPGIAHVKTIESGTAHLDWYFSDFSSTETHHTDLVTEVEYGHAEKLASGLSQQDIKFLVGETQPVTNSHPHRQISVDSLTLTREYKRKPVKQFLNHPSVGHVLGNNYPSARATFAARYGGKNGNIVALVDLTYPSAPTLDGEKFIELKRFASHPHRPPNTGSWLISKALKWASLEAYEICRSYMGIANNDGTLYQALGFSRSDGGETTLSDGEGWTRSNGRSNRSTWNDYERGRYDKYLYDPVKNIHRREATPDQKENNTQLNDFGIEPQQSNRNKIDASTISLVDQSKELIYGRRDNDPKKVLRTLERYGNQAVPSTPITESHLKKDSTAVFCGLTPEGIAVALIASPRSHPTKDNAQLEISGYTATDTLYPNNTASHLIGKVREWAAYEGYDQITVRPKQTTNLLSGIKQTMDSQQASHTPVSQGACKP